MTVTDLGYVKACHSRRRSRYGMGPGVIAPDVGNVSIQVVVVIVNNNNNLTSLMI